MNYSAYFIGAYFVPYKTVTSPGSAKVDFIDTGTYNLPKVYLFTLLFFMIVNLIFLIKKVSVCYYEYILTLPQYNTDSVLTNKGSTGELYNFSIKVLCSYPFFLSELKSVNLHRHEWVNAIIEAQNATIAITAWLKRNENRFIRIWKKKQRQFNSATNVRKIWLKII